MTLFRESFLYHLWLILSATYLDSGLCRGINAIGFFCENAQTVAEQMVQAGGIINEKTDSRIVAGDLPNGRILLRQK